MHSGKTDSSHNEDSFGTDKTGTNRYIYNLSIYIQDAMNKKVLLCGLQNILYFDMIK